MSTVTLWFDTHAEVQERFLELQRLESVSRTIWAVGDESVTLMNGDVIKFRVRTKVPPIEATGRPFKVAATPLSPRDVETQTMAIERLLNHGYTPASVVAAVTSGDLTKLVSS